MSQPPAEDADSIDKSNIIPSSTTAQVDTSYTTTSNTTTSNTTTILAAAANVPIPSTTITQPPLEPQVVPQSTAAITEPELLVMPPSALTRQDTVEAIGPSTDLPTPMLPTGDSNPSEGHVIIINLLLTSTGTRHPYKIDEKYLTKRGVTATGADGAFDPGLVSVYTLKELIWRDWRQEWEPRPSSPSAIRLIHFGRLLDDKLPLKECRFSEHAPNVVHMSVKPQEVVDDEENAKASSKSSIRRNRDGPDGEAGCRCVIL